MSYTTKLLTDRLDQALPPRHRLILACVILWVAGGAIVGSWSSHRATPAPAPVVIQMIATPTARPALAERAAPPERGPAPSATDVPPTAEPAPTSAPAAIYEPVYVVQSAPREEVQAQEEVQPAPASTLPAPGEPGFAESFATPAPCNPMIGYVAGHPCYRQKP